MSPQQRRMRFHESGPRLRLVSGKQYRIVRAAMRSTLGPTSHERGQYALKARSNTFRHCQRREVTVTAGIVISCKASFFARADTTMNSHGNPEKSCCYQPAKHRSEASRQRAVCLCALIPSAPMASRIQSCPLARIRIFSILTGRVFSVKRNASTRQSAVEGGSYSHSNDKI